MKIYQVIHSDTTGQSFELRDVLDFRPRVDDASTINSGGQDRSFDGYASTVDVIKFNSDVSSDFEYYLPKIVKVFLDKDFKHLGSRRCFIIITSSS